MLETPEAEPTCSGGTQDVEAADEGPFDRPMPAATSTSGTRNARYRHDESVRPIQPNPTAVMRNPAPTTWRPPNLDASRGTIGATTTRPTVAGRVARPAWSGLMSRVLGSWKNRLSRYIIPLMV